MKRLIPFAILLCVPSLAQVQIGRNVQIQVQPGPQGPPGSCDAGDLGACLVTSPTIGQSINQPPGTVFAPNRFANSLQPTINVMAYGAKGDGLSGAANYAAGNSVITFSSTPSTLPTVGQLLVLHNATTQGSSVNITACSLSGSTVTFTTATNSFRVSELLYVAGFTGSCAPYNNQVYQVGVSGLTSTSFQAATTVMSGTGSDTGTAKQTADLLGQVASVTSSTVVGVTMAGGSGTMIPTVTLSAASIGWATDDTNSIQSAVNTGCASYAPRGAVGARLPAVQFPQGEFAITSFIEMHNCYHVEGAGGSAGTRLVWWGANGADEMVLMDDGPSSMGGNIQFFTASNNFVPHYAIYINGFVDNESHYHDLSFQSASTIANIYTKGFVNARFDHIASRNLCGDFIQIAVNNGANRENFHLSDSTVDFGSTMGSVQGCTAHSVVNLDLSGTNQWPGTLKVDHMRIEDQLSTTFDTSDTSVPPLFKITTGGSAIAFGQWSLENLTFNMLGPQSLSIMGTNDTTAVGCPAPLFKELAITGKITNGFFSPTGNWCGSDPIPQVPEISDGFFDIPAWYPNPGGDLNSLAWTGQVPTNLVPDSGLKFISSYWTLPAAYSSAASCGYQGDTCIRQAGTGANYTGSLSSSLNFPVTQGTYYIAGWVDCSHITAGVAGYAIFGSGFTTALFRCKAAGTAAGFVSGFITVPSGVTALNIEMDSFNTTTPIGQFVSWSRPLVARSSIPIPYQVNDFGNSGLTPLPSLTTAGVAGGNYRVVQGSGTLTGGTLNATFSGAAAFTSASSYSCSTDVPLTNGPTYTSGTSVTFTGTSGAAIRYTCTGN